jgi:hypothetical protein
VREKNQKIFISSILFFVLFFTINEVKISENLGPSDPSCYELGNFTASDDNPCNIFGQPLTALATPFLEAFGDFTYVVVWGIIMGVLWLRVQNTMMVGLVGILLASVFTFGFDHDTQVIGYGLLVAAIGIALYQMITTRLHYNIG